MTRFKSSKPLSSPPPIPGKWERVEPPPTPAAGTDRATGRLASQEISLRALRKLVQEARPEVTTAGPDLMVPWGAPKLSMNERVKHAEPEQSAARPHRSMVSLAVVAAFLFTAALALAAMLANQRFFNEGPEHLVSTAAPASLLADFGQSATPAPSSNGSAAGEPSAATVVDVASATPGVGTTPAAMTAPTDEAKPRRSIVRRGRHGARRSMVALRGERRSVNPKVLPANSGDKAPKALAHPATDGTDDYAVALMLAASSNQPKSLITKRAPKLPSSLTRRQLTGVLSGVRGDASACFSRFTNERVVMPLTLTIRGKNGRVADLSLSGQWANSVPGRCLSRRLKTLRFPRFADDVQKIRYTLIIR